MLLSKRKSDLPVKSERQAIGEIRLGGAGGAQSVIYGIHPDGMRYQIVVEKAPLVISLADLDELAPGVIFPELEPEPSAAQCENNNSQSLLEVWERVSRYLDTCDPAVSEQGGHNTTFRVLCQVINRFDLTPERAWQAALYYNQKCKPPWSDKELKHKVEHALKASREKPRGHLLQEDEFRAHTCT